MKNNINLLLNVQNDLSKREIICKNINILNGHLNKNNRNNANYALYVNIRSLNANLNELLILLESLVVKPIIIV